MYAGARAILLSVCLGVGPADFAASPLEPPPATSPGSQPAPIFAERPIDWRSLVPDIYHDQKTIGRFPVSLARGRHWKPALGVGLALGGLIALDAQDAPYFRSHQSTYSGFNRVFSSTNAGVAPVLVPVALYGLGLIRKDSYAKHTSLLAGESMADSEILAYVLKNALGRRRPGAVPQGGNYSDTWFENYQPPLDDNGGFPSGHTIIALSVATIIARRYADHRWVPWVAYGAAALVGFSRLTLQAHFPSDVFAGAAFGYAISRYVVMPGREPAP